MQQMSAAITYLDGLLGCNTADFVQLSQFSLASYTARRKSPWDEETARDFRARRFGIAVAEHARAPFLQVIARIEDVAHLVAAVMHAARRVLFEKGCDRRRIASGSRSSTLELSSSTNTTLTPCSGRVCGSNEGTGSPCVG